MTPDSAFGQARKRPPRSSPARGAFRSPLASAFAGGATLLMLALPGGVSAQSEQLYAQLKVDAFLTTYKGEERVNLTDNVFAFLVTVNDIPRGGWSNPRNDEIFEIVDVAPGDKVKVCEDPSHVRPSNFVGYTTEATCIEQTVSDSSPMFYFVYRKSMSVSPYFTSPSWLKTVWVTPGTYTTPWVWVQGDLVDSLIFKVMSKSRYLRLTVHPSPSQRFRRNPALADFGPPWAATWLRGYLREDPDYNMRVVKMRLRVLPSAWRLRHGARICLTMGVQGKGFIMHPDLSKQEWSKLKASKRCFRVR